MWEGGPSVWPCCGGIWGLHMCLCTRCWGSDQGLTHAKCTLSSELPPTLNCEIFTGTEGVFSCFYFLSCLLKGTFHNSSEPNNVNLCKSWFHLVISPSAVTLFGLSAFHWLFGTCVLLLLLWMTPSSCKFSEFVNLAATAECYISWYYKLYIFAISFFKEHKV